MNSGNLKRKLAAIMYTDIVGYSAMMQEDEGRAMDLRNRHRAVFKQLHDEYRGTVLQYYGDGTLSFFDSTADAVECAVKMQQILGNDPIVPLRISVHTGDITYNDEDAYGDGLNVAARLEPMCNPGGVFISGKTYDDIKNHSYLRAESLGFFELKNINEPVEIYALSNEGVDFPEQGHMNRYGQMEDENAYVGSRKKGVAALLALIIGVFGVHRFYLGQKGLGIAYFVIALIGIVGTIADGSEEPIIMTVVVAIIAFLDAVILAVTPKATFDRKYNSVKLSKAEKKAKKARRRSKAAQPKYNARTTSAFPVSSSSAAPPPVKKTRPRRSKTTKVNPFELRGLQKYNQGDIDGAIDDFEEALETGGENKAIYFTLAKCYSLKENMREGFQSLDKAVALGFGDFDQIREEDALAFLRSQEPYQTFVQNGYRWPDTLPTPSTNLLDQTSPLEDGSLLLKQLKELEELYERGILSPEEFEQQKKRFGGM